MKTIEEIYCELLDSFGTYTGLEPREGTDLSGWSGRPFLRQRRGSIWTVTLS